MGQLGSGPQRGVQGVQKGGSAMRRPRDEESLRDEEPKRPRVEAAGVEGGQGALAATLATLAPDDAQHALVAGRKRRSV